MNKNHYCFNLKEDHKTHTTTKAKCKIVNDDEDDIYSCARLQLDDTISTINKKYVNILRCIEYSDMDFSKKYNNIKDYLKKFYDRIYKVKDYEENSYSIYQSFMIELYTRTVYYYGIINSNFAKKNVPIYSFVKQNDCILPLVHKNIKLPMIHFDTHSDAKEFGGYTEYMKLLDNKDYDNIIKHAFDISTFSTHYIAFSKKEFVWVYPPWVADEEPYAQTKFLLQKHKKKNEAQYVKSEKGSNFTITESTEGNFKKSLNTFEGDYVLSIDLDYFCTNGSNAIEQEEAKGNGDFESFGRTRYKFEFANPFYYFEFGEGDKGYDEYTTDFKKEFVLVEKRVDRFIKIMEILKEEKGSPKIIVISDSTTIMITRDANSVSMSNDFCPKHMAIFIRYNLLPKLQKIFYGKTLGLYP